MSHHRSSPVTLSCGGVHAMETPHEVHDQHSMAGVIVKDSQCTTGARQEGREKQRQCQATPVKSLDGSNTCGGIPSITTWWDAVALANEPSAPRKSL